MPFNTPEKRRAYRRFHPEYKHSKTKVCTKCVRPVMARDLCQLHYNRWRRKHVSNEASKEKERQKRRNREAVEALPNWMLRKWFARHSGVRAAEVPTALLGAYRAYLQLRREMAK